MAQSSFENASAHKVQLNTHFEDLEIYAEKIGSVSDAQMEMLRQFTTSAAVRAAFTRGA